MAVRGQRARDAFHQTVLRWSLVAGLLILFPIYRFHVNYTSHWRPLSYGDWDVHRASTSLTNTSTARSSTHAVGLKSEERQEESIAAIPHFIFSSCKTKDKIPAKVYDNVRRLAPDYEYHLFDDNECIEWLNQTYNESVVQKYQKMKKGAHKGDLFRYAILYKMGGIWMDVDICPLKPFQEVFNAPLRNLTKDTIYTCANDVVIFQAILATPPNNPLVGDLFRHAMTTTPHKYEHFLREIFRQISEQSNHTGHFEEAGLYPNVKGGSDFYLFKERCTKGDQGIADCPQGLSKRWKSCCYVYDGDGEKVFESRYVDYPWD